MTQAEAFTDLLAHVRGCGACAPGDGHLCADGRRKRAAWERPRTAKPASDQPARRRGRGGRRAAP